MIQPSPIKQTKSLGHMLQVAPQISINFAVKNIKSTTPSESQVTTSSVLAAPAIKTVLHAASVQGCGTYPFAQGTVILTFFLFSHLGLF